METTLKEQVQVIAQNLEPVQPELRLSKNGEDENRLEIALSNATIRKSNLEELKSALRYCMLKVGLRAANLPNEEEKSILLTHVIQEYGNHTVAEIKLAFDMAIVGKLEIERKEVVCYENFSCLYFSGIMNAYRTWAAQAYQQINKPKIKELSKQTKKQIDFEYAMALRGNIDKNLLPPLK